MLKPKYELLIYNQAVIERRLLHSPSFRRLAARFLPKSYNAWVVQSEFAELPPSPDPQRIRNRFFLREPYFDLDQGLEEARARNLLAFIVIYDPEHPTHSKLDFTLGYFMEYQTTKRLVDEHFVPIIGPSTDPRFAALVPEQDPLERARLVVMDADKHVIRSEGVPANPDVGMTRVRALIKLTGN